LLNSFNATHHTYVPGTLPWHRFNPGFLPRRARRPLFPDAMVLARVELVD